MKRITTVLCIICFIAMVFCFTACGRDEAKIVGIHVSVTDPGDDIYSELLADESTSLENDYILRVGETYNLNVEYSAYGGSKYPILQVESIKLKYDSQIFDISLATEGEWAQIVRYNVTCKRAATYAAILVEVGDNYHGTVIISAS